MYKRQIQRQAAAVLSGSVSVDKTQASQGETVNITYTLTNSGMTPVSVVSLADKEISSKPIAENAVSYTHLSPTISGSRAEVGSSKRSTSGPMAKARAMATRCFWPPEICRGLALI